MSLPRLSIIGAGRLGKSLARLWRNAGLVEIGDIVTRSPASAQEAWAFIGTGMAHNGVAALAPARFWMLATPDDALAAAAQRLAASGALDQNSIVFHCSGATVAEVLAPVRAQGAAIASIHPVKSFSDPAHAVANFAGTWCGTEGDPAALAALTPLFEGVGAKLVPIEARHKTLYHAAAVFACNYLVTLQDIALSAYEQAGIPREIGMQMLAPLVHNALDQALKDGPAAAITGPAARGDIATVARQHDAIENWNVEYARLYAQLASMSADLAQKK